MKRNFVLTATLLLCGVSTMGISSVNATEPTQLEERVFTANDMQEFAKYADPKILQQLTEKLGTATGNEYIVAYVEYDPSISEVLLEKFNVKVN